MQSEMQPAGCLQDGLLGPLLASPPPLLTADTLRPLSRPSAVVVQQLAEEELKQEVPVARYACRRDPGPGFCFAVALSQAAALAR